MNPHGSRRQRLEAIFGALLPGDVTSEDSRDVRQAILETYYASLSNLTSWNRRNPLICLFFFTAVLVKSSVAELETLEIPSTGAVFSLVYRNVELFIFHWSQLIKEETKLQCCNARKALFSLHTKSPLFLCHIRAHTYTHNYR